MMTSIRACPDHQADGLGSRLSIPYSRWLDCSVPRFRQTVRKAGLATALLVIAVLPCAAANSTSGSGDEAAIARAVSARDYLDTVVRDSSLHAFLDGAVDDLLASD